MVKMESINNEIKNFSRYYYLNGDSIPEVSGKTGLNKSMVRRLLIKMNCPLRTRHEGIIKAGKKGRMSGNKGKTVIFTDEHKKNLRLSKLRWSKKNAKGTRINTNGYLEYTVGKNKGKSVHRTLMEKHLGRKLNNEVVHHIDHNRLNNELFNLKIMKPEDHAVYHSNINSPKRGRNCKGQFNKEVINGK